MTEDTWTFIKSILRLGAWGTLAAVPVALALRSWIPPNHRYRNMMMATGLTLFGIGFKMWWMGNESQQRSPSLSGAFSNPRLPDRRRRRPRRRRSPLL